MLQGDIFAGINDGILSRAEALSAMDIGKHQASHVHPSQMTSQMKHDVMYHHHSMGAPPQRPLQVSRHYRRIQGTLIKAKDKHVNVVRSSLKIQYEWELKK